MPHGTRRMSQAQRLVGGSRLLRISFLLALGFLFLVFLQPGCNRAVPTRKTESSTKSAEAEDTTAGIADVLKKGADLNACRGVVQQLNSQLSRQSTEAVTKLSNAERTLL